MLAGRGAADVTGTLTPNPLQQPLADQRA